MRLWTATVEIQVLVASEDEPSDYDIRDAAREEMRDSGGVMYGNAVEITSLKDIPEAWRGSIPRGDEAGDQTCEQIVNARIDQLKAEAWNKPMPNQTALKLED